jgi:hypothetical protein
VARDKDEEWAEAKRLCRLSQEEVRMAKALGMRPRTLIGNRPGPRQRWKAPVPEWVRGLYAERFGHRRDDRPRPLPSPPHPRRHGRQDCDPWDLEFGEACASDEAWLDAEGTAELHATEERDGSEGCRGEDPSGAALASDLEWDEEESAELEGIDHYWIEIPHVEDPLRTLERERVKAAAERATRLLRRLEGLRAAANAVAAAFALLPAIERVALFGFVARPFERQIRLLAEPRLATTALWHECEGVELAAWVGDTADLKALHDARCTALDSVFAATRFPLARRHVDVFLLEPGTDRCLGRLCRFRTCPKGKPECRAPGCGAVRFLRRHTGFALDPRSLDPARSTLLFDRASAFGPPSLDRWEDDLPGEDDDIPF